jgi:hypothetical protein
VDRRPAIGILIDAWPAKHPPESRRTHVAEDGARTTREHPRHPLPLLAESAVSDRVYPAVNAMQAARSHPSTPTALVNARALKLLERDHPVLPFRNAGDYGVWGLLGAFPTHVGG